MAVTGDHALLESGVGLHHRHQPLMLSGLDGWDTMTLKTTGDFKTDSKPDGRFTLQRRCSDRPRALRRSSTSTSPSSANQANENGNTHVEQGPDIHDEHPQKRKYKRKPKPDANAPERPPSAYVMFSNKVREDPNIATMSFVDIARLVGQKWQALEPSAKEGWESRAAGIHRQYEKAMADYKQTDSYRNYQEYLADFREKQSRPRAPRTQSRSDGTDVASDQNKEVEVKDEVEALRARVKELEGMISSSQSPVESNSTKQAPERKPSSIGNLDGTTSSSSLATLSTVSSASNYGSDMNSSNTTPPKESPTPQSKSRQVHDPGIDPAADVRSYDGMNLPPKLLTREALECFFSGIAGLYHFLTAQEAEDLFNQVFDDQRAPAPEALSELCAIAALGCHYDTDDVRKFPAHVRVAFHKTSLVGLGHAFNQGDLSSIRLVGCIATYLIMEKQTSARALLSAGLQMARGNYWRYQKQSNWRKILRTLLTIESWLSVTLGYNSDVRPIEVQIASQACIDDPPIVPNVAQDRVASVYFLTADIFKDVYGESTPKPGTVQSYAQKLEDWHRSLPECMQLCSLMSNDALPWMQKRSIFLVHMMYLGAIILLHRRTLIAMAEYRFDGIWKLGDSFEEGKTHYTQCICAAQQVARITDLLAFDGTIPKRCWIVIHQTFSTSVVLLFQSSQTLLNILTDPASSRLSPNPGSSISQDLEYHRMTMNMLNHCGTLDSVAASYERKLRPLYDTLCSAAPALGELGVLIPGVQNDSTTTPATAPVLRQRCESGALLEKVQDVTGQLVDLLRNPFGHRMYGQPSRGTMYGTETWNESETGALGMAMETDTGKMDAEIEIHVREVVATRPLPKVVQQNGLDVGRTRL